MNFREHYNQTLGYVAYKEILFILPMDIEIVKIGRHGACSREELRIENIDSMSSCVDTSHDHRESQGPHKALQKGSHLSSFHIISQ